MIRVQVTDNERLNVRAVIADVLDFHLGLGQWMDLS